MKSQKSFDPKIRKMSLGLTGDEDFVIKKMKLRKPEAGPKLLDQLPPVLRAFYTETDGYMLQWSHKKKKEDRFAVGAVDILPLEKVLGDWKGVLWFDGSPKDDPMRNFRVLDYVTDEVFVGFYVDKKRAGSDMLYYYSISDTPIPMQLDMRGYVELMCLCSGFKFWQKTVLSLLDKKAYPEADAFKKIMPKLFKDFAFSDFEKAFHSVKLAPAK